MKVQVRSMVQRNQHSDGRCQWCVEMTQVGQSNTLRFFEQRNPSGGTGTDTFLFVGRFGRDGASLTLRNMIILARLWMTCFECESKRVRTAAHTRRSHELFDKAIPEGTELPGVTSMQSLQS